MFSFPFPRHFHQASHVGVKYISKYWEQHCGGREQKVVGSIGIGGSWGWRGAVRDEELRERDWENKSDLWGKKERKKEIVF